MELEKSIWIDAPVAVVHSYFTESAKMALWSGLNAELEPVPGGLYRLDMGEAGILQGRFVEVGATRIVQEVDGPEGGPSSRIEITLVPEAGGCRVNIRHEGLAVPFDRIASRGWDHHLARLSVVATGGTAGPDTLCAKPMSALLD